WFSVVSRSTHGATFWTLFIIGSLLLASWLAAFDVAGTWLRDLDAVSLNPPLALGVLTFSGRDLKDVTEGGAQWTGLGALVGLGCWALGTLILWPLVNIRFRVVTGRESAAHFPPGGSSTAAGALATTGEQTSASTGTSGSGPEGPPGTGSPPRPRRRL